MTDRGLYSYQGFLFSFLSVSLSKCQDGLFLVGGGVGWGVVIKKWTARKGLKSVCVYTNTNINKFK